MSKAEAPVSAMDDTRRIVGLTVDYNQRASQWNWHVGSTCLSIEVVREYGDGSHKPWFIIRSAGQTIRVNGTYVVEVFYEQD